MLQYLKEFLECYSMDVHWVDEFSYVFTYTGKLGFHSKSLLNLFHRVHFSHYCACVGSSLHSSGTLSQTPNPGPPVPALQPGLSFWHKTWTQDFPNFMCRKPFTLEQSPLPLEWSSLPSAIRLRPVSVFSSCLSSFICFTVNVITEKC